MAETRHDRSSALQAFGLLLALLACIIVVAWLQLPPKALPDSAPPDAFSAARAFLHIEATAQVPHPEGTPENRAVRDYLGKTLEEMGIAGEVHIWGGTGAALDLWRVGQARMCCADTGTGGGKAFA